MCAFLSQSIDEALRTWQRQGLVAMPTETVFGLAAPIDNIELISKIFTFKERPLFDPLIIHVSSVEEARQWSGDWGSLHQELAHEFWPGPLTIITQKTPAIDPLITSGLESVGLRMPNHPTALALIKAAGCPLAAPSANKFTKTSPTHQEHVLANFPHEDVCVLESGPCLGGIESTIVRVDEERRALEILRPGLITAEDLRAIAQRHGMSLDRGESALEKRANIEAPGQYHVHYQPNFPLFFCDHSRFKRASQEELRGLTLSFLNGNASLAARELYCLLQGPIEQNSRGKLLIGPVMEEGMAPKERELWHSIFNRLEKAGSPL